MKWYLSHRADKRALPVADRHYNRQKVGSPQFVPPGRCLVLLTKKADALWVTSWPFAEYVKHQWVGAWICSCFRNESGILSSQLIRDAVAATRIVWPLVPELGMVTFVDPTKTRAKDNPGRCFLMAGFVPCGQTKGGLLAFQMTVDRMPEAREAKTVPIRKKVWVPAIQNKLFGDDVAEARKEVQAHHGESLS